MNSGVESHRILEITFKSNLRENLYLSDVLKRFLDSQVSHTVLSAAQEIV